MIYRCAFLVTLVFLIGCAPSKLLNKDYINFQFKGKVVNIAVFDSINYEYSGSMNNEFPSENRSRLVSQYIAEAISSVFKDSSVFLKEQTKLPMCDSFQIARIQVGDEIFEDKILSQSCLQSVDSNALWLFVKGIEIESQMELMNAIVAYIPVKPLHITGRFVLWDAFQNKPIAWGEASGNYMNGVMVNTATWEKAARDFGFSILKKIPHARIPNASSSRAY